ncbi:Protein PRD1 [Apostasia shenzhenica]|uniref:Protein PRD1 n=1 Tax=Apostasia shenzhenica TaxID=1088818 RepID=A0A2I0AEF6_9ASPA|nr:Protein PRD1 [Apostasia shenzhenica]
MAVAPPENACRRGHRRSLALDTVEGGSICLPCFAALVSDPHSPTYHFSHALSQLLLSLALEILQKTQCDDVRMNCLARWFLAFAALLKVLVVKGFHQNLLSSNCRRIYIKEMQDKGEKNPLITLFADALKGPLLSSNEEIQVNALDLIFLILSAKNCSIKQLQVLVEENIPDYIFEVIRLSAEEVFKQKLVVGFPTLLSVLYYTSEIPLYPVQPQILKLVCNSISCFPGIISISQVADLATTLTGILKRCIDGEHPETFILSCLMFSEILMSPSSCGVQKIGELIQEASRSAVLYSFAIPQELEKSIIITCQNYLLPWFQKVVDEEVDEGIVEAVLETFHLILLRGSDIQTQIFANNLVSSYWFNLSYAYLGLFPTDQMHSSIYLILGTIIDRTLGPEFGQPIRDACLYIPSDPLDLIFLLGQKSSLYTHLDLCQRAAFLILYVCSLYGESRGSPTGNMMQYSLEAEKILLNLLASEELDLFSISMHPIALKWLFQQEGIMTSLSYLILKFCQIFGANESHFLVSSNGFRPLNIEMVAELVISADNYVAPLLISLLKELHEESREDDMTCLLNTLTAIVREFPDASNQFCLNSFACAIRCLYCSACCSSKVFIDCSLLVLNVLYAANNKMISQEGEWLAISMKLLEYVNPILVSQPWGQEARLVLSIFCLILHHSKSQVLEEASKAVLLSTSLASAIENIVQKACDKGSSLVDHDEETEIGECLTSVLLLYFFSLDSLQSNLEECFNWQELLQSSQSPPLSIFSIKCHDLCRLMHFGSSTVKLLSSKCLLSILGRISEQRRKQQEELSCSLRYLLSLIAIVEGLIFYEERIVATNCCLCLCIILNWESLELQEKLLIRNSKWLRIIMEELTMTLTAPIMASKYFKNQHKPASHVAAALIRLEKAPEWMRTVFDISCISGILGNLSAQNLTAEMVNLFRALLSKKYLNEDHIQRLSQLFQVKLSLSYVLFLLIFK